MNEENVVHTMEYYAELKIDETLPFLTTWINPEDVILRKTSRSQKDKYCKTPLL